MIKNRKKLFIAGLVTTVALIGFIVWCFYQPAINLQPNVLDPSQQDLDGNGTTDVVSLLINDTQTSGRIITLRANTSMILIPGNNSSGTFFIVDLDTKDQLKEIAVEDLGPSSDPTTSFYWYDGETLIFMGTLPGFYENMVLDGNGNLTTTARANILDTWFYRDDYILQSDHILTRVPASFYERINPTNPITVLRPLTLQKTPTDTAVSVTLKTGDIITILGCDDISWCKVQTADGSEGWFAVENFNQIKGTEQTATDFFEGLSNAD